MIGKKMELEWFDGARLKAKKTLKKGGLRYHDLQLLLCIENYAPEITQKEAATTRLLLEIQSVRHVSKLWEKVLGEWQGKQLDQMLDIFDYHVTRPVPEDNPVTNMPWLINKYLGEDFYGAIQKHKSSENMADENMAEEEMSSKMNAIGALANAGIFVFAGDVERITLHCKDLDTFDTKYYPDCHSTIAAIDALVASGGYLDYCFFGSFKKENIDYWTWYLDEAFPWAVKETNKRLTHSSNESKNMD